jgi:hypothetical protein
MNAVTGSNTGLTSYGIFNNGATFANTPVTIAASVPTTGKRSGALTGIYGDFDFAIADRQGFYVLIHTTVSYSGATQALTGTLKLKNFVFRTSRIVGGAIDNSAITANNGVPI